MPTGLYKRIKPVWNKGKKEIRIATLNKLSVSHLGQHFSPSTQFKKGATPWNKGKKGATPWNKGLKFPDIHPNGMLGKTHTDKTKAKLSVALKGIPKSEEHRRNLSIGKTGENNPQWKGGISSAMEKIRGSFEMKLWRKSCLECDKFTCQKTGQRGGDLQAHHINNFADFPELRTSIENGIILSKESHKEFHKIYGKHNNTREQLEEFIAAGITKGSVDVNTIPSIPPQE